MEVQFFLSMPLNFYNYFKSKRNPVWSDKDLRACPMVTWSKVLSENLNWDVAIEEIR